MLALEHPTWSSGIQPLTNSKLMENFKFLNFPLLAVVGSYALCPSYPLIKDKETNTHKS